MKVGLIPEIPKVSFTCSTADIKYVVQVDLDKTVIDIDGDGAGELNNPEGCASAIAFLNRPDVLPVFVTNRSSYGISLAAEYLRGINGPLIISTDGGRGSFYAFTEGSDTSSWLADETKESLVEVDRAVGELAAWDSACVQTYSENALTDCLDVEEVIPPSQDKFSKEFEFENFNDSGKPLQIYFLKGQAGIFFTKGDHDTAVIEKFAGEIIESVSAQYSNFMKESEMKIVVDHVEEKPFIETFCFPKKKGGDPINKIYASRVVMSMLPEELLGQIQAVFLSGDSANDTFLKISEYDIGNRTINAFAVHSGTAIQNEPGFREHPRKVICANRGFIAPGLNYLEEQCRDSVPNEVNYLISA